jgi:enoyl-CoA hydratase
VTLEVEQHGAIRWLYLHRPERRNALDDHLVGALDAAIADVSDDPRTDAVVIAGHGPSFCAGADFEHLLAIASRDGEPIRFLAGISGMVSRLERCLKPVVAAVHGHVVAGGLEIALACDAVIAGSGTLIGDGHLRNRLLPAAGSSVRLPRKVGPALARRLLLTGELLAAEAFVGCGWLSAVVPEASLKTEASALARRFAAAAGPAQRNMKTLLAQLEDATAAEGLEHELRAFERNWAQSAVPAALAAFLAKEASHGTV